MRQLINSSDYILEEKKKGKRKKVTLIAFVGVYMKNKVT